MKHVNDWCFRGIYNGGLWEEDLHFSAQRELIYLLLVHLVVYFILLTLYLFSLPLCVMCWLLLVIVAVRRL